MTGELVQTQKLSAQMLHSVKILESSSQSLETLLQEILNTNPLLELAGTSDPLMQISESSFSSSGKDDPEKTEEDGVEGEIIAATEEKTQFQENDPEIFSREKDPENSGEKEKEWDEYLENLAESAEEWGGEAFSEPLSANIDQNLPSGKEHFFNSLTAQENLKDFLMKQLAFADAEEKIRRGAEYIIGSLEENGFFTDPLTDIAQMANVTLPEAQEALILVQSFDPPGIGAADLAQCLLLQLQRKKIKNPLLVKLIREHLEDLGKNRLPYIAASLKITMEKLALLLEELRKLDPRPGSRFSQAKVNSIIPDVIVEEWGNEFKVTLNDRRTPKLYFSHTYDAIQNDPNLSREDKNYFKEKTAEGKRAIYELEHRSSTILRIADLIVSEQYEFMKHGGNTLKPFTMHQAADKLGVDDSTVSRGCNQKYMLTPKGLFEFKYFFSTGYTGVNGEETSRRSIMEMIREMIDDEDPRKPLSDDTLSRMLQEKGFSVARRTVMKYRESMNIASSQGRRKHL